MAYTWSATSIQTCEVLVTAVCTPEISGREQGRSEIQDLPSSIVLVGAGACADAVISRLGQLVASIERDGLYQECTEEGELIMSMPTYQE